MAVRRAVLKRVEITHRDFIDIAYEDVDFQLRALAAGEQVVFAPAMRVRHDHPLTLRALLRKSLLSGRGMARCAAAHGTRFASICRWQAVGATAWRPLLLLSAFTLALLWPDALIVSASVFAVLALEARSKGIRGMVLWVLFKPLRDAVILAARLATMMALGVIRRGAEEAHARRESPV